MCGISEKEIKINDSADTALQQIEDKVYARKFSDDNRKIFKIGIRFSTETRGMDSWRVLE
ncbi:MAG: PD-(D/E)XK nuclease domain-containing protein [Bacteroidales bacterium]|nr:PD-(D/E)XK nuclease domain-containing protein [Bacteroidales bacterium]